MDNRARSIVIYGVSIVFAFALVHHYYVQGGPYFQIPVTILDHVPHLASGRDMILLSRKAASLIPRGATVTAIDPSQAPNYDPPLYFTAAGILSRQHVVPPVLDGGERPQYVLAVHKPLIHPAYRLFSSQPEGKIYKRVQ